MRGARTGSNSPFALNLPWMRTLAQTGVHHMWTPMKRQALLRVQTTSLRGCSFWRLQTGCAIILIHLWLPTCAAVSSIVWLEISPTQRPGRPVAVSATGGSSRVSGGLRNLFVPVPPTRGPSIVSHPVLEHMAAVTSVHLHRSSHTLGRKQERGPGG